MFRQIGIGAAAVLTAGVLAIGCSSDDGGDTVVGGGFLTTDNFPGGSIQDNNLSDDQRAFSNQGQDIGNGNIFWNCLNRQAIGAFTTNPDNNSQDDILYLAWFDGSRWHAPVEVHGINEDADSGVDGVKALWLNTSGDTDQEALARNGDAIILFTRADSEPVFPAGQTVDEDSNTRLYGVYFDASTANAAATSTQQGGFDRIGTLIDFDNVVDLGGTEDTNLDTVVNAADDEDFDVSAFGFASDSLCCTHEFSDGFESVDSGERTTFVHLIYSKDPASGDPESDDLGIRYWSVQFDLTQVGNALPTGTAASVIDLPGGLDDTDTVEVVSDSFMVHNGHMFWTASGIDDAATSTDQALFASVFTALAGSVEIDLGSSPFDDSNDNSNLPEANNIYGQDHGLTETIALFTETGFNDDDADTNRASNTDLMLTSLRIDATGATSEAAGAPFEIDALSGTIDNDNLDASANVVRSGTRGNVNNVESFINRTSTYIGVLWTQEFDDIDDADDSVADTEELLFLNFVPFTTVIQTRRDPADTRVLADSFEAAQPVGALTQANATNDDAGEEAEGNAFDVQFQGGLAQGQAESQAGDDCNPGCNFQGNNLRYTVLFQQIEDQSSTTADEDDNILYLNSFTVTLGATATAPPTLADTGADAIEQLDTNFGGGGIDAFAVDAGDITTAGTPALPTAAAGRVNVYFTSNDNNEGDDTSSGAFTSRRLFVSEQTAGGTAGAKVLVSTDPAGGFQDDAFQVDDIEGGIIVPANTNVTQSPNHVGTRTFIFWTEERNLPNSGLRLLTRSYEQAETAGTTAVALADRFDPPLESSAQTTVDEDPVQIDNPTPGDLFEVNVGDNLTILRDNTTVGVYFDEDKHIYYSDTTGTATGFDATNGVPAPQLVDNDTGLFTTVVDNYRIDHPPAEDCNTLPKSQAFFTRTDTAGGSGDSRAFIRVHQ